ncbi:MAG: hypothetical protein DWQ01_08650 [Planctomycetota bacterium]|nr:MAG: hypothetical protein DWQ01_08650 [Planctomycetota bacterium]
MAVTESRSNLNYPSHPGVPQEVRQVDLGVGDTVTPWILTEHLLHIGVMVIDPGGASTFTWEGTNSNNAVPGTGEIKVIPETPATEALCQYPSASQPGYVNGAALPARIRLKRDTAPNAARFDLVLRYRERRS